MCVQTYRSYYPADGRPAHEVEADIKISLNTFCRKELKRAGDTTVDSVLEPLTKFVLSTAAPLKLLLSPAPTLIVVMSVTLNLIDEADTSIKRKALKVWHAAEAASQRAALKQHTRREHKDDGSDGEDYARKAEEKKARAHKKKKRATAKSAQKLQENSESNESGQDKVVLLCVTW
jgi:hypothetical protein